MRRNYYTKALENKSKSDALFAHSYLKGKESHWDGGLIEQYLGGILVFTDQIELIYVNQLAQDILCQLTQASFDEQLIPEEILHICRSLIKSRTLFPEQNWLTEFDIFTSSSTTLHIRSRWLNVDNINHACLMLILEDRQKAIINIYLNEAEKYGLTPREKDVWLLHHKGHTYKQVAKELGITPNTVKKHMRSIHAKTKADVSSGN